MSTIINGTSSAITFPDSSVQNTSAIVSGYVPYANLPTGSVLQVVQSVYNSQISTSSTTMFATGFTVSITPKFSTSKILVIITGGKPYCNTNNCFGANTLRRSIGGGGYSQITASTYDWSFGSVAGASSVPHSYTYLDSPATTSATIYQPYYAVDVNTGAGTYYFNLIQSSSNPTITVTAMEISA